MIVIKKGVAFTSRGWCLHPTLDQKGVAFTSRGG